MGRFVGKIAVGGRLLEDAVGGTMREIEPGNAASAGRVAIPYAAEQLARAADAPIHLITESGLTLRVVLGRSEAVGDLYLVCDFDGEVEEGCDPTTFSILAYPDLRVTAPATATGAADDASDADVVVLPFRRPEPVRRSAGG